MKNTPRKNEQQGFLLIEVLFSAALLALVIAVIAGSFSSSYRALSASRKSTRAALLLESKLSELRHTGVDAPDKGEFEGGAFSWQAAPAGECADTLCPVTVAVEWQSRGAQRSVSATTLLPHTRNTAEALGP